MLLTIAIGVVVWLVVYRFGTPGMRAVADGLANRRKFLGQDRVAQIGEAPLPPNTFGTQRMPLTIGVRAISTVAVLAFLYLLNFHGGAVGITPIPPDYFWQGYMAASIAMAWYLGYIWTYELIIDGPRLIVPTWGFGAREHDLRRLIRVEDDGAYVLRLYFDEGGKAEILKYVRGRAHLLNVLEARLPELDL